MDYNQIAQFVSVVEAGSLSEAARRLNIAKSNLSRSLSRLEKSLGTQLVYRNTRHFQPTEAGLHLFQLCQEPLFQLRTAREKIQTDQTEMKGRFIITAAVDFTHAVLPEMLADFAKTYPQIELEIRGEDRRVDLVKEGVDLALRVGTLADSNLKSLKIGDINLIFVAAPSYLSASPRLRQVDHLAEHRLILFQSRQAKLTLEHRKSGLKQKVKLTPHMSLNTPLSCMSMTVLGQGVALLPDFICYNEMKSGQLMRVLPDWSAELSPFHYVWPSHIAQSPKVKAFIQFTQARLKKIMAQS